MALSALLGLALVPSMSRALAASDASGPWAEFCSVTGIQPLSSGAPSDSEPEQNGGKHFEHCPLCNAHGLTLGLPPAQQAALLPAPAGPPSRQTLQQRAPRTLFAWASAQPRAPPSQS